MRFEITEEVQELFPEVRIGVVSIRGANNIGLEMKINVGAIEESFLQRVHSEDLTALPCFSTWRETYETIGLRKHRSTVDWLIDTLKRSKTIPRINRLVTAYLAAELEFLIPIGGYDVNRVDGRLQLRITHGGEKFLPLGKKEVELTKPNEIVYADESKILTRNWNTKDCDQAKITEGTRDAILFVEAPTLGISDSQLIEVCRRLAQLVEIECECQVETHFFGKGFCFDGFL